jgi:stress response protein YsnF
MSEFKEADYVGDALEKLVTVKARVMSDVMTEGAQLPFEMSQFPEGASSVTEGCEETLQLHAEEAVVGTRLLQGETVRVATVTHVREHVVEVPVAHEIIEVEHVPIGKVVEVAPAIRHEGDVTILPVMEEVEVVVIHRRLILKEEIHVRRRQVTETHRETISLRTQTAVVTRFVADEAASALSLDDIPSDTERSTTERSTEES